MQGRVPWVEWSGSTSRLTLRQAEKLRAGSPIGLHLQPGTVARSLLSSALDDADPDVRSVVDVLDGIPGAHERAQLGLRQAEAGQTVPLDEL